MLIVKVEDKLLTAVYHTGAFTMLPTGLICPTSILCEAVWCVSTWSLKLLTKCAGNKSMDSANRRDDLQQIQSILIRTFALCDTSLQFSTLFLEHVYHIPCLCCPDSMAVLALFRRSHRNGLET